MPLGRAKNLSFERECMVLKVLPFEMPLARKSKKIACNIDENDLFVIAISFW